MSCATHSDDISALLDGELSAVEERRLRDHLAGCAACRRERERIGKLSKALRGFDSALPVPSSDGFVDAVVARVAAPRVRRPAPSRPPVSLAAAAALLLLAGLAATFLAVSALTPGLPGAPPPTEDVLSSYRGRAAAIEPGDAGAHLVLARWCEETGLTGMAAREYVRALGADPDLPAARAALGNLLPGVPSAGDPALVRVPQLPDTGPDLPGQRFRPPTREEILTALGFSREGGRWLTEDARRGLREHREGEEILARRAVRRERVGAAKPVPSATDPLLGFLASLEPGDSSAHGSLKIVPLRDGDGDAGVTILPVDVAFREGLLTVGEDVTNGRLAAENLDPTRHVFLAAGRILRGGHQDRMLLRDVLLAPSTASRIPVVCCEKERWVGPSPAFSGSPGVATPGIRRLLLGAEDQDAIWARISTQLAALGAENRTEALSAAHFKGRGPRIMREAKKALLPAFEDDRTVGFLAFADGRFLGGEIFADHALFTAFAPEYLASYALEAVLPSPEGDPATSPDVAALLDRVGRATFYRSKGAGSGEETEFVGEISGHALIPVAGARPLHVSLFPGRGEAARDEEPPPPAPAPSDDAGAPDPEAPSTPELRGGQERRVDERRAKGGLDGAGLVPPRDRGEEPGRRIPRAGRPGGGGSELPSGTDRLRDRRTIPGR